MKASRLTDAQKASSSSRVKTASPSRICARRLRPEYPNHVWSYDFGHYRTNNRKAFWSLNILDEHTQECLAIRVQRKLNFNDVIDALTDLSIVDFHRELTR